MVNHGLPGQMYCWIDHWLKMIKKMEQKMLLCCELSVNSWLCHSKTYSPELMLGYYRALCCITHLLFHAFRKSEETWASHSYSMMYQFKGRPCQQDAQSRKQISKLTSSRMSWKIPCSKFYVMFHKVKIWSESLDGAVNSSICELILIY